MTSARETYSQPLVDLKDVYSWRRSSICMRLPYMPGYQLQECIDDLNDDLKELKNEIDECKDAIRQLKQGKDPEEARQKYRVPLLVGGRTKDYIREFQDEIERRREIARWVRRERQIYLFEKTKRRMAAVKLPLMRLKLKGLNEEAYRLLCEMKSSAERLSRMIAAYHKTCGKYGMLKEEIEKLTFTREPPVEGRIWVNLPVPTDLKELKFFRDLEVRA